MKDFLGYKDKVCVVTGAASGIGKATAEFLIDLGAKVYALDINEIELNGVKNFIQVDLCSKDAIDMAFEEIPKQIDCFFGIAGQSGIKTNYYSTFTVNYIANKYITENYLKKRMDRGGSISYVTSLGAKHWDKYYSEFRDFTVAKTWNDMIKALHEKANENTLGIMAYPLSKRALNYYMVEQAIELARRGIRVNALMPGSTDTNSINDYAVMAGSMENLVTDAGLIGRLANPQEIAEPLVFLNSDMARFISGYPMVVDYGYDSLVNLGIKKDKSNVKVGSKLYNLDFMQKMLSKKYNITPVVGHSEPNIPVMNQPAINTIMEGSNTTEMQVIHDEFMDQLEEEKNENTTPEIVEEVLEEEEIL